MKYRVTLAVLVIASALVFWFRTPLVGIVSDFGAPPLPPEQSPTRSPSPVYRTPGPTLTPVATPTAEPVSEINLGVPFSSQAPHGNWDLPYQEACEEASAMMVDAFWDGRPTGADASDAELRVLVQWQQQNFGYYFHTTAERTADILRRYYGYSDVRVSYDITADDIRRELAAGRPVIIPAAGRLLGNPNFKNPGPVYHMLVVKGFTADGRFITNDPGTRNGHNYVYSEQALMNAIHDVPTNGDDWPAGVDPAEYILSGRKAMIVVYP
ncbi:MAG TPA: C39 family peptidase [Candidatus Paceibacterota bacterium]|nr:C39 family peptidase [Candidatus Paceibacterota bacterium]